MQEEVDVKDLRGATDVRNAEKGISSRGSDELEYEMYFAGFHEIKLN